MCSLVEACPDLVVFMAESNDQLSVYVLLLLRRKAFSLGQEGRDVAVLGENFVCCF